MKQTSVVLCTSNLERCIGYGSYNSQVFNVQAGVETSTIEYVGELREFIKLILQFRFTVYVISSTIGTK